jgi:phosphoglycolate phosphatase-like HAD superfamily hydrolase
MKAADLDAVTLDAHGTLVTLADPVAALTSALSERGVERTPEVVLAGFQAEVAHYAPRASEGHDEESLARLQRECVGVFLKAVDAGLGSDEFVSAYISALHFDVLPGVVESLDRLRALGLELAVVANWDLSLHRLLDEAALARYFKVVVHAARKPAPGSLLRALGQLQIDPGRALHIGDDDADRDAARAAGMQFAPAPVPAAVAAIR